ncbi:hypothetical protein ACWGJP_07910 [Microbacterium sp. NPDC055903]
MGNMFKTLGRVLAGHWPALLAWFLAGRLVHYVLIEVAAQAGAWTSTGGLLILPIAVLARLVSFVAMFLVVRDGLRELSAIAPSPPTPRERRQTFLTTLLASILPFFAIYAAWGFLTEDTDAYSARALAIRSGIGWTAVANGEAAPTGPVGTLVGFDALTISLIAVAFVGRWAWKKWQKKVPASLSIVAVYLEAVWVFLAVSLIGQAMAQLTGWVDTRVGLQWVLDAREWVSAQLVPVAWVWDGVEWLIGEIAGLTVEPLAWLAVAGVIYGQAIAAEKPSFDHEVLRRARERSARVPSWIRLVGGNLAKEVTSRFSPLIDAIVLMWRAGPVLIAGYVLIYTIVLAADAVLAGFVTRLIGPHDLTFWRIVSPAIGIAIAAVIEPIRIGLVASAYDGSLGALRRQAAQDGSMTKRAKDGIAGVGETSTQNGPASSGTT